ncbi:alpha-amylase family glycosyl hydrolase [Flammeovirga yaeyamensis]|nr:alpha-amylase family glycosyl hydrolase [Flammeovirga yaeyamensis]MBB3699343.1 pullulanase/glycogen debranching enzyme [Flammeovirga yaeyamensis]
MQIITLKLDIEMNLKKILFIVFSFLSIQLAAQSFTGQQVNQGYAIFSNQVSFIFDETIYDKQPNRVVVTGTFRGWDSDMETKEWDLKKTGGQWILTFDNTDFKVIGPTMEFKFRINEGEWLGPASVAPNEKGGNLVFMMDTVLPGLKAELKNENLIWATIVGERPLDPTKYLITNAQGDTIKVKGVLPNEATTTLIVPAEPLNKKRVYYLHMPDQELSALCSFDGWFRDTFSTKELGANIDDGKTTVRLFAPRATGVKLYLYKGKDDTKAEKVIDMKEDQDGVWEAFFDEDLHGTWYDFTIHGFDDPGNLFYETTKAHVSDPYTRVSDDTWGKCRMWRRTVPATPLKNGIPAMEDVISYEVHVQDFTDRLPVDESIKGRLAAMHKSGLKNSKGQKIGFDYLVDLGINVVHLMPIQEYLHYPTDDWKASFENDEYMKSQGVSEENYQWGYRTSHAMAVETRYRTVGKESGEERNEFRDLVQAFHDKDIAVIIDIVPNHTAENMDGNAWIFNFNGIDKQYYYRTKDLEHIGDYGNEVKTENRPMTQRWLIDQCQYYIKEFGIDGFRIDLAGQVDQQTLIALKEAIGQDKIVYGEPWIGSNDPEFEANPSWDWYKEDSPITFFQDDSRTAFKGPVFKLSDPKADRGWAGGKSSERAGVMKGLENSNKEDVTPNSGITYLDIHDNFALSDQYGGEKFDGRTSVDQDNYKIAVTLMYTSLGPIVTNGGSEIMRSKADAPLKEVVKTTNKGYKVYMHGYRDTYNHRTANQYAWETVGQQPISGNTNDYKNMLAFWQGMNEFRLSDYGKVFRLGTEVPEGYYQFIAPENEDQLGYIIDEKVFVLLNVDEKANSFDNVELPEGNWKLVANNKSVNILKGVKDTDKKLNKLKGGKQSIEMPATSLKIWVKVQ